MGEFIRISQEQEAGFEEPEPPSARLIQISLLLDEAWKKYLTVGGDKTAFIDDLYRYTIELREAAELYRGKESDLPEHVQTSLIVMRQPILPNRPRSSSGDMFSVTTEHERTQTRNRRGNRLGQDTTERAASLRFRY